MKHLNLKGRILLMTIITAVIFATLSSVFIYRYYEDKMISSYIANMENLLQKDAENVSQYFDQLFSICAATFLDEEMNSNIVYHRRSAETQKYAEGVLRQICMGHKEIVQIYLYVPETNMLICVPRNAASYVSWTTNVEGDRWYIQGIQSTTLNSIGNIDRWVDHVVGTGHHKEEKVFTVNRSMWNVSRTECQAILSLQVAPQRLINMIQPAEDTGESIALSFKDGSIFYASEDSLFEEQLQIVDNPYGSYSVKDKGGEYLIVYAQTYDDMVIHKAIPYARFTGQIESEVLVNMVVLLIAMILLVTVILAVVVRYVIHPIREVSAIMENTKGSAHFPIIEINNDDEIGSMVRTYNEMAGSIEELIRSDYINRLRTKNAQLDALRAQINPHFMNNLLQSIGCLALQNDNYDVYSAIDNLAELMHYTYRSDFGTITLEMELDFLRKYVELQKIRFAERLQVEIDVKQDILLTKIPNLILQPIVENSLDHGFKANAVLHIRICIEMKDERLIITIQDDGQGIAPERLAHIREQLDSIEKEGGTFGQHTGICNVYMRLFLTFGNDVEFDIVSSPGNGMTVTMKFKPEGGDEDAFSTDS